MHKGTKWVIAVCTLIIAGWIIWLMRAIERQSYVDEARRADIILVLGAAEYRGLPSPVLKSRLDHALALYQRKLAPRVLTTGGSGGDPDFTEGEVARNYLVRKGIPAEAILVEPEGETTWHSIVVATEIMRRMDLRSCVLVSDGYHIYRAKRMMESQGMEVWGSPRQSTRYPEGWAAQWLWFRQAVGVALWSFGIGW
jgi:uncharacterized SAM-binding protein YcdF (DUF218 family)